MNKFVNRLKCYKSYLIVGTLILMLLTLLIVESGQNAVVLAMMIGFLFLFLYFYNKNLKLLSYIKAKEDELTHYQDLLREDRNFMYLDDNLSVVSVNKELCEFLGVDKETLLSNPVTQFINLEDFPEKIREIIAKEGFYKGSGVCAHKDQKVSVYITLHKRNATQQKSYYLILKNEVGEEDITQQMRERLFIDSVTQLPTRLKLFHDIDEHKGNSLFPKSTLIYVGIDNFDTLNELFGVDAGTIILKRVAEWLGNDLPATQSTLYKIDFNHFAIFIPRFISRDELEEYLRKMTTRISKREFTFQGSIFNIEITAGVARGIEDLPKNAYLALKEAEKLKKSYKIYNEKEDHQERFLHNIKINKMVKEAILDQRIEPFFQPIFNLKTNQVEKYESLMRIRREDNSYATPGEFLEIAKTSKMYTELSRMMIKKCFEQLEKVQYPITINIGLEDILEPRVSQFILRSLKRHKFGNYITFEIVESESITNEIKVKNFIKKVKSYGCQIAIDDFGSGFSNFGQLLSLDADYIKIDGSLIKDITRNKDSEIMTRTIISMAKELNMKTVAEFVSSQVIFDKVKSMGIDYAQGYFIDRADPVLLKQVTTKK
jgi:EAL domain-containing protein (putative c-di-GMP-specific phosphodiesterase class I)/PAS domain-containing protein